MRNSLFHFSKVLAQLIVGLFLVKHAFAGVDLFVKSSIGPGEPLRIYLEADFDAEKDLYVVLFKDSQFFSLTANGSVVSGIVPYTTARDFKGTVFDFTLNSVSHEVKGEWLVIAAAVDRGQAPLSYSFDSSELQIKTLRVRQSSERNIDYLSRFLERVRDDDRDYIYSLYGARLISVYHPELYLQADDLFLQFLFRIEGTSWFYDRPPESISSLYDFLERPGEPSFSMEMVNLSDYEAVNDFKVYPEPIPLLNWLDRRVAPIHFILKARKSFSLYLTQLEKAFLFYFYKKYVEQRPIGNLFIVYSLDGSAYLYDNGQIFNLNNQPISSSEVSRPIVLVFNEKSVWFPLMERDDSETDDGLFQALSLLNALDEDASALLRILSAFEKEAISVLREKTKFFRPDKLDFAKYVAMNAEGLILDYGYNKLHIFSERSDIPARAILGNLFHLRTIASALSPFSDYLARALETEGGYREFSRRILEFNQWGGETVSVESVSYTIDVGFRANVGSCKDLSVYAAAGLEVAGKNWVRLRGVLSNSFSHFFVYVPEDEVYFDNGYYGDGREYGLKYAWGGVPNAGLPSLEGYGFDTIETPDGYAVWRFYGSAPDYADSRWTIYGSYSKDYLLSLLQNIYREAEPKPVFSVLDPNYTSDSTFTHVFETISFEKGLELISRYYRQFNVF